MLLPLSCVLEQRILKKFFKGFMYMYMLLCLDFIPRPLPLQLLIAYWKEAWLCMPCLAVWWMNGGAAHIQTTVLEVSEKFWVFRTSPDSHYH